MFSKSTLKFILLIICANFALKTYAQEIRVIDNKGTLKTAINNSVTSRDTAPTTPLEGDVWYDTNTSPTIIKIYNDGVWVNLTHTGTEGSVFFAGSDGVPTEHPGLFWKVNSLGFGSLGIGTNNPTNKLEVDGAIGAQGILNSNGTVNYPSYRFKNDPNTGMFRPNLVDQMGFVAGGEEAIHIVENSGATQVDIIGTLALNGFLLDEHNTPGTPGQILTATATGTKWDSANTLQDADGDTSIKVEKNTDEDIIRFGTGNTTANRQVLRIDNPGAFSGGGTNSAVLGLEANGSSQFDSRLRITAGNDDTFNDTQGASIDLHGNSTTANTGRVDLVAGSAASGANLALTVWGNDGLSAPTSSTARIVMTGKGNVGIGNTMPNDEAILDLTNTQKRALLLPTETTPTEIATPTDGMLLYASNNKNAYLRANNTWKPITFNSVNNELIFDGNDHADTTNDNFRYVSLIINGDWKVIRYNKTDVNVEDIATQTNNTSQTTQPITLAACVALTF
ncbi:hypothetical protein MPF19_08720 [Polaribacter sp. Z014]|uniref:hypothetical protein n=1 Tax=Polaribacter sp. Z014 TaxID=2927126 RepID=UPI0020215E71|nr:hypothetical protein [Polaribacter sp. Z014]MCL7763493.1 hypothetical protein [Polaribacter sp. Z014]